MAAMSLQVLQKSALSVVPVAQTGKGQTSECFRSKSGTGMVAMKAENLPIGKAILIE
jgi:hypothetical protein